MTAKGYTTEALVEGELLITIDATTKPTSTQLVNFIEEAEAYIDELTNSSFTSVTVTDEIIPFNDRTAIIYDSDLYTYGGLRNDYGFGTRKNAMFLSLSNVIKRPIISITSLYRNLTTDDSGTDSWELLTQQSGTSGDYILDKTTGMVIFVDDLPYYGHIRAVKATFAYGYSTVPLIIRKLATKLVARRVLEAKAFKSQMSIIDNINLDSISLSKGIDKTVIFMNKLDSDIDILTRQIVSTFSYESV